MSLPPGSRTPGAILAFPFRLREDGSAATVVDGTEDAHRQELALLALTRKGERPYVPDYGTSDPVGDLLDVAELNAALGTFGPAIVVDDVEVTYPDDQTALAVLTYSE